MKRIVTSCGIALAVLLAALSAQAQTANRVWVSGKGTDAAGCGAPTDACRSLQYALDNVVVARGEIDILDPAGYGSAVIHHAVSIVNDGVGTAGVQATHGDAVVIEAGASDAVYLRGLNIDGVHQTANEGIYFLQGASLTIANCVVRNFSDRGIYLQPVAGPVQILITNTTTADNLSDGFAFLPLSGTPTVYATLDHLVSNDNLANGISIGALTGSQIIHFVITNTIANNNAQDGLAVVGVTHPIVMIDQSNFDANGGSGVLATTAAEVYLSRSVMSQNVQNGVTTTASTPGGFFSTGDNRMESNGAGAVNGTMTTAAPN